MTRRWSSRTACNTAKLCLVLPEWLCQLPQTCNAAAVGQRIVMQRLTSKAGIAASAFEARPVVVSLPRILSSGGSKPRSRTNSARRTNSASKVQLNL